MLNKIKGFLLCKNESFDFVFDSDTILNLCFAIIFLSCLGGAIHPFLIESNELNFELAEFLTKFIGLIAQNLFIISGIYFIGVSFFANKIRIGITDDNKIIENNNYNILNIRRMFQLLSFSQLPVIIGMVSVVPGINSVYSLVSLIVGICTIWFYVLVTKAVYIGFGYNFDLNSSIQIKYIKSFLIVLFTYIPGTIIFQLFISSLIKNLLTLWI